MNSKLNDIVIGIDHGFKNMKTAHCCFPTALTRLSTLPDDLGGVLQFNGDIYKENGEKLNYVDNADKTKNDDFYILTLFAIAKEFKERGITSANITLATGLPQRWYEKQKNDFQKYLSRQKEILFKYEGKTYHVCIKNVNVYTQGYAAFMTSPKIMDYIAKEVCIVDIGGGTMDIIRVNEGSIMSGAEGSKIDTRASIWLINQIQEQVETDLCTTIPESTIISYMQCGSREQEPQNKYEEIMQREFKNYSDMLFTKLKEYRINVELIPVIFIGGGSAVIRNFGEYNSNTDFITDIKANALGYESIMNLLS
jgi:plasmid segregation protein ParM